jgi:hypothetical protein
MNILKARSLNDIEKKMYDVFNEDILKIGAIRTSTPLIKSFSGTCVAFLRGSLVIIFVCL